MDVDFYKRDMAVFMQLAGEGAVRSIGGDEGRQGCGAGVGEEECDLFAQKNQKAAVSHHVSKRKKKLAKKAILLLFIYFRNPPNILPAILLAKPQIPIQTETHIIAVEAVSGKPQVQQVLLEGDGDGRFAAGGEAREPEREARLVTQGAAFGVREPVVPCYVSDGGDGGRGVSLVVVGWKGGGEGEGGEAHLRGHCWIRYGFVRFWDRETRMD